MIRPQRVVRGDASCSGRRKQTEVVILAADFLTDSPAGRIVMRK